MGRPFGTFKYDNIDDLEAGIQQYFEYCDTHGKPYTMSGLALSLNITTQTLCNYGKADYADVKYFDAVNRARQKVLDYNETRLYDKDGVQGAKFALINNAERMGGLRYADRQEMTVQADVAPDVDSIKGQLRELLGSLSDADRAALGAADDDAEADDGA